MQSSCLRASEEQLISSFSDEEFTFRWLQPSDYDKGFLETLKCLTKVGEISRADFEEQFDEMFTKKADVYKTIVILDNKIDQVIGAGSLIIERKFIRQLGSCGHIEDIVVRDGYRGKHLGLKIIEVLKKLAWENKCYKVILDCSKDNVGFYEKNGFKVKEVQMVLYASEQETPSKL